jgi:hypothetical protein
MTHDELRDRLLDLAYGELSPHDAREVEAHAASCEACRAELARIRGTRLAMSALPVEPAPAKGEGILLAAAREAAERRSRAHRPIPRWLWRGAIVALPVAAVVAVSFRLAVLAPRERSERDALVGESGLTKSKKESEPPRAPPDREAERSRRDELAFATPPPPAPSEERAAPRAAAPAPQANAMSAPAPAPEQRDEARARELAGAPSAPPPLGSADAAPRRAAAKAAQAPSTAAGAVTVSPRQRAIDAAVAHAARMAYDARKANVTAGDEATSLAELAARSPGLAGTRELEGKSFWVVSFSPKDDATLGGDLTVFVEDGTFRVIGAVRQK